jgi:hypothetical protein
MKPGRAYLVIIGLLAWSWLTVTPAAALNTYTWTGNALDSNYATSGNWSPTAPAFPANNSDTDVVITKSGATVNVYGHSTAGALTMGGGNSLIINPLGMSGTGMQFRLGGALAGAATTVDNDGLIQLNRGPLSILSADSATVTLTGSGQVVLWGDNFSSGECAFTGPNTVVNSAGHTIAGGGGTVSVVKITNEGAITATHGTLICNSNITQSSASPVGTMNSSPGNTLDLRNHITGGNINTGGGNVVLTGVWLTNLNLVGNQFNTATHSNLSGNIGLDPTTVFNVNNGHILNLWADGDTPCTLNNYGAINLNSSGGGTSLAAHAPVTFTGTGSVTMGGNINNQLGNAGVSTQIFINDSLHTIQGGGTIATATTNNGKIIANNGTMSLTGMVSGSGSVDVMDNATLYAGPGLQCGNFTMSALASLNLPINGGIMDLKGNYTFAQTDPARVNFGNWTLKMSGGGGGGGRQFLEVGGQDLGPVADGFRNNFQLPRLVLAGASTYVGLVDNINNGHRGSGREALYVGGYWTDTTLSVPPETTLDLNGVKLYAYLDHAIRRVSSGDGAPFGGGRIIDRGAGPATSLLLLSD